MAVLGTCCPEAGSGWKIAAMHCVFWAGNAGQRLAVLLPTERFQATNLWLRVAAPCRKKALFRGRGLFASRKEGDQ